MRRSISYSMSDLPPPPPRVQDAVAGPSGLRRARSPHRAGAVEPPAQRQRAAYDQEVVLRTDEGADFDLHSGAFSSHTPPAMVFVEGLAAMTDSLLSSVAVSLREQEVIRAHSADLVRAMVRAGVIPQRMSFRALELLLDGRWIAGAVHWGGDHQAVGVEFTFTRNEDQNSVPRSTSHRVVVPGGLVMPRQAAPQHPAARRIVWYLNITQLLAALLVSYSIWHRVFRRSLGVGLRWPSLPW